MMTMLLQGVPPLPPVPPPEAHPFDPNLIFLTGGPPLVLMIVLAGLAATVIILWPIMRAFGRRLEGKGGADPALRSEVEQLHARIGEMETLQARMAELEERVDFTERLLSQNREPDRLQR
jgi:Tfp pilus assembly protein PilO